MHMRTLVVRDGCVLQIKASILRSCSVNNSVVYLLTRCALCFDLSARPLCPPQCGTIDSGSYMNLTERNLQDAQKFLLMHEVVQPVDPIPYFMEDGVRFTHVAVDVVQGKDMLFHIIFLATGTFLLPSSFFCIIDLSLQENVPMMHFL